MPRAGGNRQVYKLSHYLLSGNDNRFGDGNFLQTQILLVADCQDRARYCRAAGFFQLLMLNIEPVSLSVTANRNLRLNIVDVGRRVLFARHQGQCQWTTGRRGGGL